jgi:hypothetical protein
MSKMISPNDLQKAAQDIMLDGREPESENDWVLCVNFWAYNVDGDGREADFCKIMGKIFNCPLNDKDIEMIAAFQVEKKRKAG